MLKQRDLTLTFGNMAERISRGLWMVRDDANAVLVMFERGVPFMHTMDQGTHSTDWFEVASTDDIARALWRAETR